MDSEQQLAISKDHCTHRTSPPDSETRALRLRFNVRFAVFFDHLRGDFVEGVMPQLKEAIAIADETQFQPSKQEFIRLGAETNQEPKAISMGQHFTKKYSANAAFLWLKRGQKPKCSSSHNEAASSIPDRRCKAADL
jgi:hypothetical protein